MSNDLPSPVEQWIEDCERTHGRVLAGACHHWCREWDGMPIDETCPEFDACLCYPETIKEAVCRGNFP